MSGKAKREAMSDASARIIGELTSSWRVNNQIRNRSGGSKTQKVNPAVVPTCVGLLEGSRSDPPCRRLVQMAEKVSPTKFALRVARKCIYLRYTLGARRRYDAPIG